MLCSTLSTPKAPGKLKTNHSLVQLVSPWFLISRIRPRPLPTNACTYKASWKKKPTRKNYSKPKIIISGILCWTTKLSRFGFISQIMLRVTLRPSPTATSKESQYLLTKKTEILIKINLEVGGILSFISKQQKEFSYYALPVTTKDYILCIHSNGSLKSTPIKLIYISKRKLIRKIN